MLKINRVDSKVDYDELYDVLVDGLVVMKVGNNAIGQADIKSGKHVLQVKSKDYVSNKIKFNIGDGEILEYLVEPDYLDNKFSKFITKTLYGKVGIKITLKSDIYI